MIFFKRIKLDYLIVVLIVAFVLNALSSLFQMHNLYYILPNLSLIGVAIPSELSFLSSDILAIVFLGVGYLLYKKRAQSSFLVFVLSFMVCSFCISIIWSVVNIVSGYGFLYQLMNLLFNVLWIAVSIIAIIKLLPEKIGDQTELKEAKKRHRLVSYLIDSFLFIIVTYMFESYHPVLSFVLILITWMAYYSLLEYYFGFTLGKLISGTRVVNLAGESICFKQSILRTLIRLIPVDSFSFVFSKKGWHDSWTETRVIKTEKTFCKWYHFVLPIPTGMFFLILFILLPDYVDIPINEYHLQKSREKEMELSLEEIYTNFNKIDTTMVLNVNMTFEEEHEWVSSFNTNKDVPLAISSISADSVFMGVVSISYEDIEQVVGSEVENNLEEIYPEPKLIRDSTVVEEFVVGFSRDDFHSRNNFIKAFKRTKLNTHLETKGEAEIVGVGMGFREFPELNSFHFVYDDDSITLISPNINGYCEISNVEVLEGDMEIDATFPIKPVYDSPPFTSMELRINVASVNVDQAIRIEVTYIDSEGKETSFNYSYLEQYTNGGVIHFSRNMWE